VSVLERKLARDLWRLKGQVATIALVLACGLMAMLMMRNAYQSLLAARDAYYTSYRFADVFARLVRAPDAVADRLEEIPGVRLVYPRIVQDVMVPIAGEPDPVTGRIVSIPDDAAPPLNALYLRAGRTPTAGAADEAVVLEQFAEAHQLRLGDRLPVVLEGRLREIQIVGIALSPEYVLAMSGAEVMPDKRRFVVLWMSRRGVAPAFQMDGAFNDVVFQLAPDASVPSVLDAVDRELAPYGGFHATSRDKQMSAYSLDNELLQLRTLALVIPAIFLAVAAFLVNVVVSRLVFLERTQIAVLKALGFSDRRISLHYLGLVALIVAIAGVVGTVAGAWSARWMTDLYADFYRFPTRLYHLSPGSVLGALGVGFGAAVVGALGSIRRVTRMQPAQAMRPPTPLNYKRTLAERVHVDRFLGASAMMVVREIERRPLRFILSAVGIAMGVSIFLLGRFSWDSFDRLMNETYLRGHREDITVMLRRSRPATTINEIAALPGVEYAEGQRNVPVRISFGSRWRDTAIIGLWPDSALRTLLDHGTTPVALPDEGVVMTDELARRLGVRVGDTVQVEVLEEAWPVKTLTVGALLAEPFGILVYARADWLAEWLGEEPRVSALLLSVDPERADELRAELKQLPEVLGVASTQHVMKLYREQTGGSMVFFTLVLTFSAAAISIGVVYNNARISLSLRSRDLATLRVLGFTRREISTVLLGELGAQVMIGIPLGLVLGGWGSHQLAAAMSSEQIRFPVFISSATFATAAAIALVSGIASALLVRRKLDQLDLISVLKASE
jgi:putative ABC transport system permease protein